MPTANDVYVQSFPDPGSKYLVSAGGGRDPLWSPDGAQLFYLQNLFAGSQVVAVDVQTTPTFTLGKTTRLPIQGILSTNARGYDITPDGKSFLVMFPVSQDDPARTAHDEVHVVLNWAEELKAKVPSGK